MNALGKRLRALTIEVKGSWTPEEVQLAQDIATDYADLLASKVIGEGRDIELAHVRAAGQALLTAGAISLADVLEEEIRGFLNELISDLVPGL